MASSRGKAPGLSTGERGRSAGLSMLLLGDRPSIGVWLKAPPPSSPGSISPTDPPVGAQCAGVRSAESPTPENTAAVVGLARTRLCEGVEVIGAAEHIGR